MSDPNKIGLELLDALRNGADHHFPVKFGHAHVIMRPLTVSEMNDVATEAALRMQKLPEEQKLSLTQSRLVTQMTLMKASTSSPEKNDPTLTALLLDRMYPTELTALYQEYCAICDKVNPMLEKMPPDEVKSLVEALKKSPSALTERSFWELVNVCQLLMQDG